MTKKDMVSVMEVYTVYFEDDSSFYCSGFAIHMYDKNELVGSVKHKPFMRLI